MAQNTSHAVMAQRTEAANSLDFFPTQPWATRALCEILQHEYPLQLMSVWEPACGAGDMSRPLAESFREVYSSDIKYRGYGEVRDFFEAPAVRTHDWIITNPPFNMAEEFVVHALNRANVGVAMFVRTTFLESVGRYNTLFRHIPPSLVLQFTERVPIHKGKLTKTGSTATAYCWVVWEVGYVVDNTILRWIPPCRKRLERDSDYEPVRTVRKRVRLLSL